MTQTFGMENAHKFSFQEIKRFLYIPISPEKSIWATIFPVLILKDIKYSYCCWSEAFNI